MLKRGRIGEGWLGEMYAGEDKQGRPVRLISLGMCTVPQRDWVLERMRRMNRVLLEGSCPQLGIQFVQGEPMWVGAWRQGVQLAAALERKHLPNTVIMSVVYELLQVLANAQQKGIAHGCLDTNGIWLDVDGSIWLDGFGETFEAVAPSKDVFDLGCMILEMFLGERPFPVSPDQNKETLIRVGQELKAMGLPGNLPRQILQLLHPDPTKRPSLALLLRKWQISRSKGILSSWVKSQFRELREEKRPEDQIPTVQRIAPLPFPLTLQKQVIEEIAGGNVPIFVPILQNTPLEKTSALFTDEADELENQEKLEEVDTAIFVRGVSPSSTVGDEDDEVEVTLALPERIEGDSEDRCSTEESLETTRAIEFFDGLEEDFFTSEVTGQMEQTMQLYPQTSVSPKDDSEDDVELHQTNLQAEMANPSRRSWHGLLWMGGVGFAMAVALFLMIPRMPSYPEEKMGLPDGEEQQGGLDVMPLLIGTSRAEVVEVKDGNAFREMVGEGSTAAVTSEQVPKNEHISKEETSTQSSTHANVATPKVTISTPVKATEKVPPKESGRTGGASKPKTTLTSVKVVEVQSALPTEPLQETDEASLQSGIVDATPVEMPPKKPFVETGSVSLKGSGVSVRLVREGKEYPLGTLTTGTYEVYATFDGFSEFKVSSLTIQPDTEHIIRCDSMFATCKVQ